MKLLQLLFTSCLLAWSTSAMTGSRFLIDNDFSLADFDSVSEAVESIKETLEDQGLEIFGVIDHSANAKKAGLELPPTQLILFRDPLVEKRLLLRNQKAAVELPQKILVFEEEDSGLIKLFYNSAGYIAERHALKTCDHLSTRLNRKLNQFGRLKDGLVTIKSEFPVAETFQKLKHILLDNDFIIPFTLDFSKNSLYGTKHRQTQLIIFGNPTVGTLLMKNQRQTGIDLPQKFLVWEDRNGLTQVTYNDPKFLGKRHALQGLDTALENIANKLAELVKEGTTQ